MERDVLLVVFMNRTLFLGSALAILMTALPHAHAHGGSGIPTRRQAVRGSSASVTGSTRAMRYRRGASLEQASSDDARLNRAGIRARAARAELNSYVPFSSGADRLLPLSRASSDYEAAGDLLRNSEANEPNRSLDNEPSHGPRIDSRIARYYRLAAQTANRAAVIARGGEALPYLERSISLYRRASVAIADNPQQRMALLDLAIAQSIKLTQAARIAGNQAAEEAAFNTRAELTALRHSADRGHR